MQRMRALLDLVEASEVTHIVVTVPRGAVWTLPAYELALLFSMHARKRGLDRVRIMLVTPEDEPLLLFGGAATDAIRILLGEHHIALQTGYSATAFEERELHLFPQGTIEADAVVALPALRGPWIDGVPQTREGFVVTDASGRVDGIQGLYAAGDVTNFPVKQGGIATQQADAAAESIAAEAGASDRARAVQAGPPRPASDGRRATFSSPRHRGRWAWSGDDRAALVAADEARRPTAGSVPRQACRNGARRTAHCP